MSSIKIGSVLGISIRLGVSFLLVLPVLAYLIGSQLGATASLLDQTFGTAIAAGALTEGALPWVLGLAAALGLFASVLLHEFGHSLVGRHYGFEVESITLWFLGGLAQFTEMPEDWRQEFAVAVVGPIVSVGVGVACYVAFVLTPSGLPAVQFVLGYLAILNVALAAFNMLPGFPMDGGRVLRAVLSRSRSRLRATQIAAGVGKGFAVLLGLFGLLAGDVFLIAIAFFVFIAATAETRQVLMEAAFDGLTAGALMTPREKLDVARPDERLSALLDRMMAERHTGYPVLEGDELRGVVTLEDVQSVPPEDREDRSVADVMSSDLVTVDPGTDATDALRALQSAEVGRVLVTGADGALLGLLTRSDFMTVLEIQQAGGAALHRARPAQH